MAQIEAIVIKVKIYIGPLKILPYLPYNIQACVPHYFPHKNGNKNLRKPNLP